MDSLPNDPDSSKICSDATEALIVYTFLLDVGRVEYVRSKVRDEGIEEVDTHKIVLIGTFFAHSKIIVSLAKQSQIVPKLPKTRREIPIMDSRMFRG